MCRRRINVDLYGRAKRGATIFQASFNGIRSRSCFSRGAGIGISDGSFTLFVRHGLAAVRHFGRFCSAGKAHSHTFYRKAIIINDCGGDDAAGAVLRGTGDYAVWDRRQLDNFCRRCVANKMHSFLVAGTIISQ